MTDCVEVFLKSSFCILFSERSITPCKTSMFCPMCLPFMYPNLSVFIKVSKGAKIRNRYNQVPHLTQDTNGEVTNSQ